MKKVYCTISNSFISNIDRGVFFALEKYLIESGLGADKDSFEIIKERLQNPPCLNAIQFAYEVIYVILASGFKQKIAKQKFFEITKFIESGKDVCLENLISIFGNKNKINAICKVWKNKEKYSNEFYKLDTIDEKLNYLENLPYIGAITKNHIARNLGINKVKYDVWIQRLGIALYGNEKMVVSSPLDYKVQKACDKMFEDISNETKLSIGYIDVVLWKSCQIGLLKFEE
ncbi:MAG: hypothetical protein J6J27_03725 [Alphaproteobacteria bacterium]|nr:hypothetical protein [Alphaproteobacteria bacterium]